ncbi:MAG: alpha-ketoacid dehydrogenase subunit beta [Thermoproteota archaeon]|jgi:pyruvate/2-oxoglutarate/acetoin dehydrogenase E1 component|nr:alpha-ketoacid dehydrogenase subunit beta [Thermoproteota archaeon]
MPVLTLAAAINNAIREQMRKDDRIVVLGEDVGKRGGVFLVTEGLLEEFGPERVIDTPLSEAAIFGVAAGMAIYGLKPIAEVQFFDFAFGGFDQIVSQIAKLRYRSGGQFKAPVIIRGPVAGGIRGGMFHSQSPETYYVHTAGLKVIVPAFPYDAKGLLIAALKQDDPVIFMEPKSIYRTVKQEVPEGEYIVPIGKANVIRQGDDVTVITYGAMVHRVLEAAEEASKEKISVEVIDLRTLMPYDIDTILSSIKKTGRVVIVHEAPKTLGFGAEIAASIAERALLYLEAPIIRVCGQDTPFPLANEHYYLPTVKRIKKAITKVATF